MIFEDFIISDLACNGLTSRKFSIFEIFPSPSADLENIHQCPLCQIFRPVALLESQPRPGSHLLPNPGELTETRSVKGGRMSSWPEKQCAASTSLGTKRCINCTAQYKNQSKPDIRFPIDVIIYPIHALIPAKIVNRDTRTRRFFTFLFHTGCWMDTLRAPFWRCLDWNPSLSFLRFTRCLTCPP